MKQPNNAPKIEKIVLAPRKEAELITISRWQYEQMLRDSETLATLNRMLSSPELSPYAIVEAIRIAYPGLAPAKPAPEFPASPAPAEKDGDPF